MTWAVFAAGKTKRGALAGDYGGASAEATVGVGLGANVLIGGFKKMIALQPLSIQGQKGLNIAASIAGLSLRRADSIKDTCHTHGAFFRLHAYNQGH